MSAHWSEVAPAIQGHLIVAVIALTVGIVQLVRTKGTPSHRQLGWLWVLLMAVVALSSFWIQALRPGHYSWIHLLSVWTLFSLTMGIWMIRAGKVRRHRGFMVGTFIGLLIAGGFALFDPARVLSRLLG